MLKASAVKAPLPSRERGWGEGELHTQSLQDSAKARDQCSKSPSPPAGEGLGRSDASGGGRFPFNASSPPLKINTQILPHQTLHFTPQSLRLNLCLNWLSGQAVAIFIARFYQLPFHFVTHHRHQVFQLGLVLWLEPAVSAAAKAVEVIFLCKFLPSMVLSVAQYHSPKP